MDHFKCSMDVRQRIIEDKTLLRELSRHFIEGKKLETVLGHGSNHIHFRAGSLPGGPWLATRERFVEPIPHGDPARTDAFRARFLDSGSWKAAGLEMYCKEAYCWSERFGFPASVSDFARDGGSGYVTAFTIGVRYKPAWKERPLYALLVEDLTAGGSLDVSADADDDSIARVGGMGPVRIDLDDFPRHAKRYGMIPDYMSEGAIIDLDG